MFDILFGWRKASKCKRLIRRLQRRLKVLKNKRSTVVRQWRDDVAELLKHGHMQTAFDRVEQLFKDECLVAAYDLLDSFCEFIINNLHYIRRNKDCPNDINEAVSSLIFASARFGDLPELIAIRKLFGERYGQRFATVAIELLPGNLVNRQMQEKVCIKSVSRDQKCRLVEEIHKSSIQSGPLLIEYSSEFQQKLENRICIDPIPGAKIINQESDGSNLGVPNSEQEEKKLVQLDLKNENQYQKDLSTSSVQKINQRITTAERSVVVYDSAATRDEESASSESSSRMPEEVIYLDDIQELESPQGRKNNLLDQRVFKFRSSALLTTGKTEKQDGSEYKKSFLRKDKNASTKRLRRRSVSGDAPNTNDMQRAIYYGESGNSSPDADHDWHTPRPEIPIKQPIKTYYVQELPNDPSCITVENLLQKQKHQAYSYKEPTIHLKLSHCCCSCRTNCQKIHKAEQKRPSYQKTKKSDEDAARPTLLVPTCSGSSSSSLLSIKERASYLRAMTLPLARPQDACIDPVLRSNSFPLRQQGLYSKGHVHPNLPDYDELAATFTALKDANLQGKRICL